MTPKKRRTQARPASQAWGFLSIASAGATRPRNEGLQGGSLDTIAFRCELWRWSHQVLQEYIRQQKATL